MLTQINSPDQKVLQTRTNLKKYEFQSKFAKNVPVVVERFEKEHTPQFLNRLKFLVPYHMTVSQFATIVRDRMALNLNHGFHLLLKKRRTVVRMSQCLGKVCSEYKDQHGWLYFTFAAQNTFGCPVHLIKPIKSKFPGIEPTPFGAPEPFMWMLLEQNLMGTQESGEIVSPNMGEFIHALNQLTQSTTFASQLPLPPVLELLDSGYPSQNSIIPYSGSYVTQALNPEQASIGMNSPFPSSTDQMEILQMGAVPPGLPFNPLIQSLNTLAPFTLLESQVQPEFTALPVPPLNTPEPPDFIPLMNALNALVQALQDQILFQPYGQNETTVPPPNATESLPHFPSTHFYNQMVQSFPNQTEHNSGTNQADAPGQISSAATAIELIHSVTLANQIIQALQQKLLAFSQSNQTWAPTLAGASCYSEVIQYFNIVAQYLQNQTEATVSQPSGGSQNIYEVLMSDSSDSPSNLMPVPYSFAGEPSLFSVTQHISYLYDSDEFSEEDIDVEYNYN